MAARKAVNQPVAIFEDESTAPRRSSPDGNPAPLSGAANAVTPLFEGNTGRGPAIARPVAPRASRPPRGSSVPPRARRRGRLLLAAVALLVAFVLSVGIVAIFDTGTAPPRANVPYAVAQPMPWTVVWEYFFPPKHR